MQKRILASLLVTPLAFSALADITVNNDGTLPGWAKDPNVIGDDPVTSGSSVSYSGNGWIFTTVKGLNPGTYTLVFTNANNVKIDRVEVNGTTVTPKNNQFTVSTADSEAKIFLTSADEINGFSFDAVNLNLVVDFAKFQSTLQTSFNTNLKLEQVYEEDDRDEAKELRDRYAALKEQTDAIQEEIDELNGADSLSADDAMALYNKYELWKPTNKIQAEINGLKTTVSTYNKEVKAENAVWDLYKKNVADKAVFDGKISDLRAKLQAQREEMDQFKADQDIENASDATQGAYLLCFKAPEDKYPEVEKSINDFEAAVEKAYADLYETVTEPQDKTTTIQGEISKLAGMVTTSEADWNAYTKIFQLRSEVLVERDKVKGDLDALKGVADDEDLFISGKEDNYATYIAGKKAEVDNTYNTVIQGLTVESGNPVGAAKSKDVENLEGAKTSFQDVLTDATATVELNNQRYISAMTPLAEYQKTLNRIGQGALTGNQDVKKAQQAIDAVKKLINDDYAIPAVKESYDYSAVETALNVVKKYEPLQQVNAAFKDLRQYIEDKQEKSGISIDEFNLAAMFAESLNNIEKAIDALEAKITKGETVEQGDIDTINGYIDEAKTKAGNLMDAYAGVATQVKSLGEALAEVDDAMNKKMIIEGSEWTPELYKANDVAGGAYTAVEKKYKDFDTKLKSIVTTSENPQDCYDKTTAFSTQVENYKVSVKINSMKRRFEQAATDSLEVTQNDFTFRGNYVAVQRKVQALSNSIKSGAIGMDTIVPAAEKIEAKLADVRAYLNKNKNSVNFDVWAKADTMMLDVLHDVDSVKVVIKKFEDNKKAYDDLLAIINHPETGLQVRIDAVDAFNAQKSAEPALTYYHNLITSATDKNALQYRLNDLKAKLDEAYAAGKALEQTSAFNDLINKLAADIDAMKPTIVDNNANHDVQLVKSDEVRAHVNSVKQTIEAADKTAHPVTEEWLDILNGLLTDGADAEVIGGEVEGLNTVDGAVTTAYGEGKSKADNMSLLARYKAISDAADKVLKQYEDTFDNRVASTNDQTVKDAKWSTMQIQMDAAYNDAIAAYNQYYALSNQSYREYVIENAVKTHENIYNFGAEIAQLKADVQAWVDNANRLGKVFTQAEFEAVANAKATALINQINAKVAQMIADADREAKKYYSLRDGEVTVNIKNVESELQTAGIAQKLIDPKLKPAKDKQKDAKTAYDKAIKDTKNTFSLSPMNDVADKLDEADRLLNVNANALALTHWKGVYKVASDSLTKLNTELVKITNEGSEYRSQMNAVIANATGLNTEATTDENLIANLNADLAKLNGYLVDANVILKAAQDVEKYEELYDGYVGDITNLRQQLEDLKTLNDAVVADDEGYLAANAENISDLIDAFEEAVVESYNKGNLKVDKTQLDTDKTDILTAINLGFVKIKTNEQSILMGLLSKTKVAYNNASVLSESLTADQMAAYQTELNGYEQGIKDLLDSKKTPSIAKYTESAVGIENDLSALYVTLMSSYESQEGIDGGSPVPAIIEALTKTYNDVDAALSAALTALDACEESVKTDEEADYAGQYAGLKAELDAVKAAWEADGDRVVLTQGIHTNYMNDILARINALAEDVKAANEDALDEKAKAEINQKAYDRLSAELDGYQAQVDALKAEAEAHGVPYAGSQYLNDAQNYLNNKQNRLQEQYENKELNESSILATEEDLYSDEGGFFQNLYFASCEIEKLYADKLYNNASNAIGSAHWRAQGDLVPEVKDELMKQISALYERLNVNQPKVQPYYERFFESVWYMDFDSEESITPEEYVAAMHEVDDEYLAIIEAVEAIEATAIENTYIKGDLSGDNVVNVLDLQRIIRIVGQGISYEDLYNENPREACAADVTNSGDLNIADVSRILQMILDGDSPQPGAPRMAPRRGVQTGDGLYGFDMISNDHAAREYAVAITGADGFVAAQLDVTLPAGMTLEDAILAGLDTDHELQVFDNGNGNYRLLIFSMSNAELRFENGLLLTLATQGVGNPEISNVIFSDANGNAVMLNQADRSMLDSIKMDLTNLKDRIYNAAGQTLRSIQRGINIIRKSDGTSKKELH
ncbi:MAG: hypothetical protein ACI303_08125 [Lepagella sp.]